MARFWFRYGFIFNFIYFYYRVMLLSAGNNDIFKLFLVVAINFL